MATPRLTSQLDAGYRQFAGSQPEAAPKIKITELITALTGLVSVILARGQTERARFWAIIAVGFAIALVGIYRPLIAYIRQLAQWRHDDRVVRKHMPEFRRMTREAGRFIHSDIARPDTLGGILHEVQSRLSSQPHHALLTRLTGIPNQNIFIDRWLCFNRRVQKDRFSVEQFHVAMEELTGILQSHTNYCMTPIFHTFASEYREILTDNERSQFNAFQQSYRAYLERFSDFAKRLDDEFRGLPQLETAMALPKPL